MTLAGVLAKALDPVAMAPDLGMVPDEWQADLLRNEHHRVLLNIHRQGGKSTTCAVVAAHRAQFSPDSLILCVAPVERQAKLLFRKIKHHLKAMGVPLATESATSLTLANGSEVVCVPGNADTVRGYSSVDLLLIDEASRVPDDVYGAVSPMVAISNGTIIAMSTPHGKRGWWSDAWHDEEQDWRRFMVVASECPRLTPEQLRAERLRLGPHFYAQEYEGQFKSTSDAVFSVELIDSLFTNKFSAHRY